jgi:hypothetical protein
VGLRPGTGTGSESGDTSLAGFGSGSGTAAEHSSGAELTRQGTRVGGHPVGRFCRWPPAPTARRTDWNVRGFQIGASGFPPDPRLLLDAS